MARAQKGAEQLLTAAGLGEPAMSQVVHPDSEVETGHEDHEEEAGPAPAPRLAAVPAPEVQPEELEPEPELEPERVVAMPLPPRPQAWSLWEIERLVRETSGEDPLRDEERAYLLVYLREFASPDGVLPVDFDALVRESFGEVVTSRGT